MGFRKDAWAKCWEIKPISDTMTNVRVSISRKNKETGEYIQDFSGFITFTGTSVANKASKLKEGDKIKLGDVDVTNKYEKESNRTFTNFKCFSFEMSDSENTHHHQEDGEPVDDFETIANNTDAEGKLPF